MDNHASATLFSLEGAPFSDPGTIEAALAQMWRSDGKPGQEHEKVATRISVANLVVVAPAAQWNSILEVLGELSPVYPTRTIALLLGDEAPAGPPMTASVSAICHVPQEGETQVCCEQIIIRTSSTYVEDLDQTLLPFLESDVPVMCWWRYGAGEWPDLFAAICSLARRVIVDDGGIIQNHLTSTPDCAVRDIGWYQTAGLRELVAQMFDECGRDVIASIQRIDIETGDEPVALHQAYWMTAFLAGQLDWKPVTSGPLTGPGDGKSLQFSSGDRTIEARISRHAGGPGRLRSLMITSGENTFEVTHHPTDEHTYRLTVCAREVCQAPRTVHVACRQTSEAIAAALVGRPIDPAFERAQPIAAWMAHSTS